MKSIFRVDTAKDWEHYGKSNPYFGVLVNDKFLGKSLSDDVRNEFYKSGENHIDRCLDTLENSFGYTPKGKAMDFGCGVGRLTNALSKKFDKVVGYDVSASMLETARSNSKKMGNDNIDYACTADGFNPIKNEFDMIHCYIVIQHIPVQQGMALIDKMLGSLSEGGVGALHLTFANASTSAKDHLKKFAKEYYIVRALWNAARLKHPNTPSMQMNNYDLNSVFQLLNQHGIDRFFCDRIDDWGNIGLFIFFEKSSKSKSLWSNPRPAGLAS